MDINDVSSTSTCDYFLGDGSTQGPPNLEDSGRMGGEEVPPVQDTPLKDGFSHLVSGQHKDELKDRQRAKSLPAYTDRAALLKEISENCRKRVQFADALGLNLASVKHFSVTEDPQIPSNVFSRLQSFPPQQDREGLGDLCDRFTSALNMDRLVPAFKMPVDSRYFDAKVQRCQVALEKVTVSNFDIRGLIRALTSGCSKREVGVRYTFNDWLSFVDVQAILMPGEDNAAVGEQFAFTMYTPPFLETNSLVHFAVYCMTDHGEFWDNNEGRNYTLKQHSISNDESVAFNTN